MHTYTHVCDCAFTWMNAQSHTLELCVRAHTHTHTNPSLSPNPLGKQSPASAAKLPKLSHPLMGYLSPCKSASLSTLMSLCCLSVCLPLCLFECLMSCLYVCYLFCLSVSDCYAVWWLLFSSCLSACWLIMQLVCFCLVFFFVLYDCYVEEFVLSMYKSFKGNLFMYFLWSC